MSIPINNPSSTISIVISFLETNLVATLILKRDFYFMLAPAFVTDLNVAAVCLLKRSAQVAPVSCEEVEYLFH